LAFILTPDPFKKPYSPALAVSIFNTYADPDSMATDEPAIGPEGFEKLCNDAQIPLDGALPLVLAWILDAKEMAKIWKDEWVKATGKLQ
jgi:DCN1-like protein 4/5